MFLAVKGVQQVSGADNRGASTSDLFTDGLSRDILSYRYRRQLVYTSSGLIYVCGLFGAMEGH